MNDKSSKGEEKAKRRVVTKEVSKTSPRKEEVLRPSDIGYCQCSVSNKFKDGSFIGVVLDDIVAERCFAGSIKQIEVARVNGKWYSNDNRRLWVFKQLEHLGRLDVIRVKVVGNIPACKFTTNNDGTSVEIRGGSPGGKSFKATTYKRKRSQKRSKKNKQSAGSSAGKGVPSACKTLESTTLSPSSLKQEVTSETNNLPPDDAEWEPLDDFIASIDDPVINECFFEVYHYDTKPMNESYSEVYQDDAALKPSNDIMASIDGKNLQATTRIRKHIRKRKRSKKDRLLTRSSADERERSECDTEEGMELPARSLKQEVALESVNLPPDDGGWRSLNDIIASNHDPVVNYCYFEVYRYDTNTTSENYAPSDVDWFDYIDGSHDCEEISGWPACTPFDTVKTDKQNVHVRNMSIFDDNISDFVSHAENSNAIGMIDLSSTDECVHCHTAESCSFSTNVGSSANFDITKCVLAKAPDDVDISRLPQQFVQSDWTDILSTDVDGLKLSSVNDNRRVPDGTDVDNVFITEKKSRFDELHCPTKRKSSPSIRNEKQQTDEQIATGLASDIGHIADESDAAGKCVLFSQQLTVLDESKVKQKTFFQKIASVVSNFLHTM
ncbi:hypothetical protein DPMN_030276 [Dreissena polymorpha]|uniref:Uncharacterized protein n=1 Tax=Dreissena polymorpha TaxID=45954 RepID=A0A9D4RG08_DREPO|nr:hypothetical protein DPMN_030276 [Dreissena polymorpha]